MLGRFLATIDAPAVWTPEVVFVEMFCVIFSFWVSEY